MNRKSFFILTVVSILVGSGAFYAGIKYQQGQRPQFTRSGPNSNPRNFRPVNGEIILVDEKSLTLQTADGGSKIILISGWVSAEKLTIGTKITVIGQENSDGSITAQNIHL